MSSGGPNRKLLANLALR